MPVLPKSLFVVGTSFQTALAARRFRRRRAASAAQQSAFRALVPAIARTEAGRETGVSAGMDYAGFRSRVPLRNYEQLAPAIERMIRGEANVLWPGACSRYVNSSDATGAPSRKLPVTEAMLAHFRQAGFASLMCHTTRVGHAGVMRGRHLFLGGSSEWTALPGGPGGQSLVSDPAGILELNLPRWAERHLYEPGAVLAHQPESNARTAAIAQRTKPLDITLIAGRTDTLLNFASVMCAASDGKAGAPHLQAIWPNLECVVHSGAALSPQNDEIRRAAGPSVTLHEVYAGAEGVIAAQDSEATAGLRLLTEAGLFFEFLPLSVFDDSLPAALGARAVALDEVRVGDDYVLVLTTPAGLCRYVTGEIVRFTSTEPPRLVRAGRTRLQLNAFGEHVFEKDLTAALVAICRRHGWSITGFHVAPLFAPSRTGTNRGGHEWWVELRPATIETPTGPLLATEIDREFCATHEGYAARRRGGSMQPPVVRLVMPGFFANWLRHHAGRVGHSQLPRCRSDRLIADNLSGIACFTPD